MIGNIEQGKVLSVKFYCYGMLNIAEDYDVSCKRKQKSYGRDSILAFTARLL